MDGFFYIFEKLSNNAKIKLLIVIIGLLAPSLVYLVLNFPNYFLKFDFIKTIIACIVINFTVIFTFTFTIMLSNLILYTYRSSFIKECKARLNMSSEKSSSKSDILQSEKQQDIHKLLSRYPRRLTDVTLWISLASFYYILTIILKSLLDLFRATDVIFKIADIKSYFLLHIIVFTLTVSFINIIDDRERVEKLKDSLSEYDEKYN